MKFGAQMQKTRGAKKVPFPTCPVPEYQKDRQIKKVADWSCGGDFDKAETMLHRRPARFYRHLGWADVDADAEGVANEHMAAKAKDTKGSGVPQTLGSAT